MRLWRGTIFFWIWLLSTLGLGWLLLQGAHDFDYPATPLTLLALLLCGAALIWRLSGSASAEPKSDERTQRGKFILILGLAAGILFPIRTLIGPPLLYALPALGIAILLWLRPRLDRREGMYALLLALLAGIAGLGAGWVTYPPPVWAALQVGLVLTGLLAGWSILRFTGLLQAGIGRSLFLAEGLSPALRGFSQGMLIGMPWAFGMLLLGSANQESWVQAWWQPLIAIQTRYALSPHSSLL